MQKFSLFGNEWKWQYKILSSKILFHLEFNEVTGNKATYFFVSYMKYQARYFVSRWQFLLFFCFLIWSCCCDLKIVTWASGKLNFAIANLYRSATHTAILNIFVGCIITTWWLMGLYSKGKLIFNDLYLETS